MTADQQPDEQHSDQRASDEWRAVLTGTDPTLKRIRSMWQRVPSSPRCKICAAPFGGLGRLVTRLFQHGQARDNPLVCSACFGSLRKQPGGAEVEISVLFADIRGSTGLAERSTPIAFRSLLQDFYRIAWRSIDHHGGIVDKYLGDGIMALFIPVIAGDAHARRAIHAAETLLTEAARVGLPERGALVGAGVQSGPAFVGVLGSEERLDFSALGDTVNVAARLGSAAGPGELLVSRAAWLEAGRSVDGVAERTLDIQGRSAALEVVSVIPSPDGVARTA